MKDTKTIKTILVTAVVTCLLTNTVNDFLYIRNNGKIMRKLSEVTEKIKDYSIYHPDDDTLADAGAEALAEAVGDPYTRYIKQEEYSEYMEAISSSYMGLGITLISDSLTGEVTISEVKEGEPAAQAGVMEGDVLLRVDGKECNSEKLSEVIKNIKTKKEGDVIDLRLRRGENEFTLSIPVTLIKIPVVSGQMLSGDVGYLRIDSFSGNLQNDVRTAYDEFVDTVSDLRDEGMMKLVIDLRDNPGGEFNVVARICDEILSEGVIVSTVDKDGKPDELRADEAGLSYEFAVITNSNTASAAEILTAALHDNGRAVVVGEKTYGKGVVQTYFTLSDGSGLAVTSARYYTPNGDCIDGIGIEPDIECYLPEGTTMYDYTVENDPQILCAVAELNK